jgi:hypothetical protein
VNHASALALFALTFLAGGPSLAMAQPPTEPRVEVPESAVVAPPTEDRDDTEPELPVDAEASTEGELVVNGPDEEFVLGQSALRLDMSSAPLSMESLGASTEEAAPLHHELELALRLPTYDFDGVSFISASRSLITAVLETYCAAGLLFPGEDGYDVGEVVLGAGCLLGATTLYIMGIRKLLHPSEERRAVERLARFEALRNGEGLSDEDVAIFENELHSAARRDRRRRIIEIVFGGLNIVATATIAGLTARGRMNSTVGTSIATGTAALGVLSLSSIFVRSPSERAWSGYEAR